MPERMKPYSLSAALLLMVVYLGFQALTGER
ncbi:MAG: septum formation initiator family protein, partial [Brevundimonas sp.]